MCGGGVQKRSVSCRATNWTHHTSSYCADVDRPIDKRSCNEQKCTLSISKATDTSGMVKDTPPGAALLSPSLGRNATIVSKVNTAGDVNTRPTLSPVHRNQSKDPSEEPSEGIL